MKLTVAEQKLLDVVFEIAGDCEGMVRRGIIIALRNVKNPARRTYLWGLLFRAAVQEIRRAKRKVARQRKNAPEMGK